MYLIINIKSKLNSGNLCRIFLMRQSRITSSFFGNLRPRKSQSHILYFLLNYLFNYSNMCVSHYAVCTYYAEDV